MPPTFVDSRVLITGANRGLGRAFVDGVLARGATTVYAGARDAHDFGNDRIVPVKLDITNPADVQAAARRAKDVEIVINNAGRMSFSPLLSSPDVENARAEMETNYFGTLSMCRAFAPILAANGGGALINILSVVSWIAMPINSSYAASKSAAWSLTNAARTELRHQGTLVTGVFAGLIDTEMSRGFGNLPKATPQSVVEQTLDGVEAGAEEVLIGERTRSMKAALSNDQTEIYPGLQQVWDDR